MSASPAAVRFGTAYYPDHWPEADWARDLDRIRAAGVDLVRFGEFSWAWFEPRPGEYRWDAYDRFVDLVEARGLRLCLCTPTATPPRWMDTLFPDGRLVDQLGQPCRSHRHYWCWNHPGAWAKAAESIEALATRYAGRPCLWGWQIDNEPNYAEQVHLQEPLREYDFNPHSRRAWVAWLRARHGSLGALNEAWWTRFWSQQVGDWDELLVSRGKVNPAEWLDFLRWREHSQAEFVGRQAALLRRCSPGAAIGCNVPETGYPANAAIGQDYFAQARGLDWLGTDLYQATGDRAADLRRHAFSCDLMRSAAEATEARFLVTETQAGPHWRAWPNGFAGEGFGPDYLADCARAYADRGAEEIWWFLWRPTLGGVEVGMNGVQDLAGDDTARTAEVRRLAKAGPALARGRRAFRRRPVAHVHWSRDSLLLRTFWPTRLDEVDRNLLGWHGLLEALGWRVDFLDDAGVLARAWSAADLLVLPESAVMGDALAEAVAASPARLVAGPKTASLDEHARLRTSPWPAVLARRFGANPGLWHDTAPGLPLLRPGLAVGGWRELVPTAGASGARPVLAFAKPRRPALLARRNAVLAACDLGDCWWRGTRAQRSAIAKALGKLLDPGGR